MIEKLRKASFRTKNRLLIGGVCLIALLSYQFALAPTLRVEERILKVKEELSKASSADERIEDLEDRLRELERGLVDSGAAERVQRTYLDRIGELSREHPVRIHSVKEPHRFQKEGLVVRSHSFELEGGFHELLKVIHKLNDPQRRGRITHVRFKRRKGRMDRKERLYAEFLVQHIQRPS